MKSPSRSWSAGLVLLGACKGCTPEEEAPAAKLDPIPVEAAGVHVGAGVGTGTVDVPYFVVNEAGGVVVGADAVEVAVDRGTVLGSMDAFGWGTAAVDVDARSLVTLTAAAGVLSGTGSVFGVGDVPPTAERVVLPESAPGLVVSAGGGLVWASGGAVYWSAGDDRPPVRVLDLGSEDEVTSLEAAQIDGDGVADLILGTVDSAVLLRGRDGGGLVWGVGYRVVSGTVNGVSVADLDGDGDQDLVVANNHDDGASVVFATQSDAWIFTETTGFDLDFPIYGVSAQAVDAGGVPDILFMTAEGLLRRYGYTQDTWLSDLASDVDLGIGEGATLPRTRDLTRDGVADILVYGARSDGLASADVVSLAGSILTYPLLTDSIRPATTSMAFADLDGDGSDSTFLLADDAFTVASYASDGSGTFALSTYDLGGPIRGVTPADVDGDGVFDAVSTADDGVLVLPGSDSTGTWYVDRDTGALYALGLLGVPWAGDVNGDGLLDLVGFRTDGAAPELAVMLAAPAGPGAPSWARGVPAVYGTTTAAVDLAVCGPTVWALLTDGFQTTLDTFTITEAGDLSPVLESVVDDASFVVCDGAGAATVTVDGAVTRWATDGTSTPGDPVPTPVEDVASSSLGQLSTCTATGCVELVADVDGDGIEDPITLTATGTSVTLADGTGVSLPGAGAGWAGDVDGDGVADLVLGTAGRVAVYRFLYDAVAPGIGRSLDRDVEDAAHFGDVDGDGAVDLLTYTSDGGVIWVSGAD